MLNRTGLAALAAVAFLNPNTIIAQDAPAASQAVTAVVPSVASFQTEPSLPAEPAWVAPTAHEISHGHNHSDTPSLAPGQSKADYHAWLARSPENRAAVRAFRARLAAEGVEQVVPVWQLIRTSSSWRQCSADRFEVAPADKWGNIVATLKFVRDQVEPAVGEVEALSVYRNETLNACSAGAPKSAHRMFFALDLTPASEEVTRAEMIRSVCAAHGRTGRNYDTGLGFYSGRRFHVDSSGFRKWGPDGSGATSPCATGAA